MASEKILIYSLANFGVLRDFINEYEGEQALVHLQDTRTVITKFFFRRRSLKTLENLIRDERPTHIIGFGYYRRGTKYIRAEQVFKNIYGKSKVIFENGRDVMECLTPYPLLEGEGVSRILRDRVRLAYNAGNSWCNLYGYSTLYFLEKHGLKDTKFTFLHVPRDWKV